MIPQVVLVEVANVTAPVSPAVGVALRVWVPPKVIVVVGEKVSVGVVVADAGEVITKENKAATTEKIVICEIRARRIEGFFHKSWKFSLSN